MNPYLSVFRKWSIGLCKLASNRTFQQFRYETIVIKQIPFRKIAMEQQRNIDFWLYLTASINIWRVALKQKHYPSWNLLHSFKRWQYIDVIVTRGTSTAKSLDTGLDTDFKMWQTIFCCCCSKNANLIFLKTEVEAVVTWFLNKHRHLESWLPEIDLLIVLYKLEMSKQGHVKRTSPFWIVFKKMTPLS